MGKRVQRIDAQTLKRLENYHWPGNVRELQNIVERGMIASEADALIVHDGWLASAAGAPRPKGPERAGTLADLEREAIEAALRASQGRVAGPFGAAKRLGIPATTLESKIKSLAIDKRRFKQT